MRTFALIFASGLALALAACGGGDDDEPTATPATGGTTTATAPAASATTGGSATAAATATKSATSTSSSPTSAATSSATSAATLPPAATTPVTVPPVPTANTAAALLKDVRIGLHPETKSERIVFEFSNALPEALVEYIAQAEQCGSGQPVDVAGGEVLSVRFANAAQHDQNGNQTFASTTVSGTGAPITEARQFCDFEAVLSWAVGVKGMQPFVVSQLSNPPRLVIDILQ